MDERHWDGAQGYTPSFQAVAQMQNVSRGVNAACTATAARGEEWKCFMAQYTLPHVETPYYIVNSFYDEWQWGAVLGMPWKTCGQPPKHSSPARPGCARTLPPACPLPARNALEQLRAHMIGNQSQSSNAHSSAFLYSCNTHCGQFSHDDRWGTLAVKSKSLRTSFTGWLYGGKGAPATVDCDGLGCNPTCCDSQFTEALEESRGAGLSPTLLHLDARKMVPAGGTKTDDETELRADDQRDPTKCPGGSPPPPPPPPLPPPSKGCLKECSDTPCRSYATGCPTDGTTCKLPSGRDSSRNECQCNKNGGRCAGNLTKCPPPPAKFSTTATITTLPGSVASEHDIAGGVQCICFPGCSGQSCEKLATKTDDEDMNTAVSYLLLDSRNVASVSPPELGLVLGKLQKDPANPVLKEEKPWEKLINSGYPNVFYDEEAGHYKMWYGCQTDCPKKSTECPHRSYNYSSSSSAGGGVRLGRSDSVGAGAQTGTCYATSVDGRAWYKPALGAVEWNRSLANNLVMLTLADNGRGFFKDTAASDTRKRYKMFGQVLPFCLQNSTTGLCVHNSGDGNTVARALGTSTSPDGASSQICEIFLTIDFDWQKQVLIPTCRCIPQEFTGLQTAALRRRSMQPATRPTSCYTTSRPVASSESRALTSSHRPDNSARRPSRPRLTL